MSEHSETERAALIEAGRRADMHDPGDAALFAAPGLPADDAVAALKKSSPHLFRPRAKDMTSAQYDAALRAAGVNPKTVRRNA